MSDYLQPDFYRFNQDSLELTSWVKSKLSAADSILDLGAGSGIIGLELAQHYRPQRLTLLELQPDFKEALSHNVATFYPKASLIFSSFSQWQPDQPYDLIVCNPPYYLPGKGQPSTDVRRGIARSFIQDDWSILLQLITKALAPSGMAALVIKNEPSIISEIQKSKSEMKLQFHDLQGILVVEGRKKS